jgi:hypothetical protein
MELDDILGTAACIEAVLFQLLTILFAKTNERASDTL